MYYLAYLSVNLIIDFPGPILKRLGKVEADYLKCGTIWYKVVMSYNIEAFLLGDGLTFCCSTVCSMSGCMFANIYMDSEFVMLGKFSNLPS